MIKTDLTGKTTGHITFLPSGSGIHTEMCTAFNQLRSATIAAGFELKIVSGFRDFERQLKIWNGKYLGLIPIKDKFNNIIDVDSLDPLERCKAILTFSALPGASRHHWGTDFDFIDQAALIGQYQDYQVQLTPDEYTHHGPFAQLHNWLMQHAQTYNFHFPYMAHHGGISEEPWHLSYTPKASEYLDMIESEPKILFDLIMKEDIEGKQAILRNFEHILDHYILNVNRGSE